MSASEDEADVDRVLAGEVTAFENIVRRWQGPLVNLAYRFCRDRSRAEEMAQDAFLRVYRGLEKWRKDAAFSTWLFAVAFNLYRSELRRIPAQMVSIEGLAGMQVSSSADESWADRNHAVRKAVLSLPAKYREVMILFYFHDMDIAATARNLALPEGTIKARLSRGREMLRQKLQRQFGMARWKEA